MTGTSPSSKPAAHDSSLKSTRPKWSANSIVAVVCCVAAYWLGAVAMAGWIADRPILRSLVLSGSEMKANTAFCLCILPVALLLAHFGVTRWLSRLLAAVVAVVAVLTLWQYFFGANFGIDEFLFRDPSRVGTSHPGRMSPPTAAVFLCGAFGTFCLRWETRRGYRLAEWSGLLMAFVPIHILTSYAYGNMTVLAFGSSKSYMAVPTATALLLLAVATLAHAPDRGFIHTLTAATPASRVFRRLLLAVLIVPPLLGWFVLRELGGSSLPPEFGVSTTVMLCIAVLVALGWWNAASLNRAEIALQASERAGQVTRHRLETILNNSPIMMWTVDGQGIFTSAEGRGLKERGYLPGELLGKSIFDTIGGDSALLATTRSALRGELTHAEIQSRGRWFENHYAVVRNRDGTVNAMVAVSTDVTARKEAERLAVSEKAAQEASRLKSEFLASMSHEIRTPMNGILGMTALLRQGSLDADSRAMVNLVHSSGEALLAIINDILDLSKIEAGGLRLNPANFDLPQLVADSAALFAARAQEKRLRLRCETEQLPFRLAYGDQGRIAQILANLISNAVKFTERGEVIVALRVLSASETRMRVKIEVNDTGIGIAPETKEKLFEPFVQADETTATNFGGTGLGLAICRRLAKLMNATVDFTSELNRGSRFWLEVELLSASETTEGVPVSTEAPTPPASDDQLSRPPYRPLDLLVVEDHRGSQLVAQMLLTKLGHRVQVVEDGLKALDRLQAARFDAVLMDCRMPGLNGYDTSRRIRSGTVGTVDVSMPIIALTAFAQPTDRQKCLDAGMDEYVSKPLSADRLAEAFLRCGLSLMNPDQTQPVETASHLMAAGQIERLRRLPGLEGPSLLPEMVAAFLHEMPPRMAELERALARRCGAEVVELAHTIAGSAATFDARRLRACALALEEAAEAGAWDKAIAQLGELLTAFDEVQAMLARECRP